MNENEYLLEHSATSTQKNLSLENLSTYLDISAKRETRERLAGHNQLCQ